MKDSNDGTAQLTQDQVNELKNENSRAFNDLMSCMPTTGKWLQIIKDLKSDEFDGGCGKTAYDKLMTGIAGEVDGDRNKLKDNFESQEKISYSISLKDQINHLKLIKDKLE